MEASANGEPAMDDDPNIINEIAETSKESLEQPEASPAKEDEEMLADVRQERVVVRGAPTSHLALISIECSFN
jgi:hypothetical protein